jgi:hypothetical protein
MADDFFVESRGAKSSVFNRLGREVTSGLDTTVAKTASDKTVFKVTLEGVDDSGLLQTKASQAKVSGKLACCGNCVTFALNCLNLVCTQITV